MRTLQFTLLTSAVWLVTLVRSCPPGCEDTGDQCTPPSLDTPSPPPPMLNTGQIKRIEDNKDRIMMLKENPDLLRDPTNQTPIVTLTPEQQMELLERFPMYFSRQEDLPTLPGSNVGVRKKRVGPKVELLTKVCESTMIWEAVNIAVNGDNDIVQVVQFDGQPLQQWFLTETCAHDFSLITGDQCTESTRYVSAYVIDLSGTDVITKNDWIQVDCCSTFTQ